MKYANEIIQKTLILSSLTGQEIGFIIGNMLSWLNKGKGYVWRDKNSLLWDTFHKILEPV